MHSVTSREKIEGRRLYAGKLDSAVIRKVKKLVSQLTRTYTVPVLPCNFNCYIPIAVRLFILTTWVLASDFNSCFASTTVRHEKKKQVTVADGGNRFNCRFVVQVLFVVKACILNIML